MQEEIPEEVRRKATVRLTSIYFERGRGAEDRNLSKVLSALWEASRIVGTPGFLERSVFNAFLYRSVGGKLTGRGRYLKALEARGCFGPETKVGAEKGKPLLRIHLIKQDIKERVQKKERSGALRAVKAPARKRSASDNRGVSVEEADPKAPLRPEGKDSRSLRDESNATLVFVDIGNLTGYRVNGASSGKRILPVEYVSWPALYRHIVKNGSLNDSLKIKKAFAYLYAETIDGGQDFLNHNIKKHFDLVLHSKADIDPLMAGDIGAYGRDLMEEHKNMTLVVVSGDGDYNRAIQSLQEMAQKTCTNLTVWRIMWRPSGNGHIVRETRKLADRITWIENITGLHTGSLNDPVTARL